MKISATFDPRPAPKPAAPKPTASPAARNLALAYHLDRLIERGLVADFTAAARLLGVSQPRLTHLMGLLLLAPEIQEAVLLEELKFGDKELRALARVPEWDEQLRLVRERALPQPAT